MKDVIFRNVKPGPLTEVSYLILDLLDALGKKRPQRALGPLYKGFSTAEQRLEVRPHGVSCGVSVGCQYYPAKSPSHKRTFGI